MPSSAEINIEAARKYYSVAIHAAAQDVKQTVYEVSMPAMEAPTLPSAASLTLHIHRELALHPSRITHVLAMVASHLSPRDLARVEPLR